MKQFSLQKMESVQTSTNNQSPSKMHYLHFVERMHMQQ